jgi:hypothetical protein
VVKKLHLVSPAQPQSDDSGVPDDLGPDGARLWQRVQSEFDVQDIGGLTLLEQAARALDRAERCRRVIDEQGEAMKCKGGVFKEHPLLRAELQNRALVARLITKLGIDLEPIRAIGRPPKLSRG